MPHHATPVIEHQRLGVAPNHERQRAKADGGGWCQPASGRGVESRAPEAAEAMG